MRNLLVKKNAGTATFWMFSGNALFAGFQILNMVGLARLGNAEQVGQFTLGLAISAPIMLLFNLGLRTLVTTDSRHLHPFTHYQRLRYFTTVAGFTVTLLAGYLFASDPTLLSVVALLALAKSFENQSDLYYGALQRAESHIYIVRSLILRGFLGFASLTTVYALTHDLVMAVAAYALSWGAACFLFDRRVTSRRVHEPADTAAPRWADLKPIVYMGIPLGISALVTNINLSLPRLFISETWGLHEVGIFSAMAYLVSIGSLLMNSAGQAASARLARYYAAADVKSFCVLTGKFLLFAFTCGLMALAGAFLLGRYVLLMIFGPEFAAEHHVFTLLCAGAPFIYMNSIMGYVMAATRRNHYLLAVQCGIISVMATMLTLFLPLMGLPGAALSIGTAAFSGNCFFAVLMGLILQRKLRQRQIA